MVSKASNNPITTAPALCRKDPEANTVPLTQMPVEIARKPDPAASATCYCYGETKASNVGSLSTNQTTRSHQTTREEMPTPKYSTKFGITAIRPSGNQCV